jgi:beta-lactam-binding protein with PASTA domain
VLSADPTMAMAQMGAQSDPTQVVGTQGPTQHNTASLPAVGHDPAEEPPKRHKATYVLLAVAVVAALVLVAMAGKAMFGGTPAPPTLTVPSVISLTQPQAVAKLQSAGFLVSASTATSTKDKGTVIDQSPSAGERHPAKTTVNITVSSGPGDIVVPDVTGFTQESAQAAIKAVGLTIGQVVVVDDPTVNKGLVIETVPKANVSVPAGSAVTLRVSSGKVKVPDVVGANRAAAQQTLTNAGLKYTTKFADSTQPEGTVLAQTHAGETVDVGTEIVLTVAQLPQPTPTPTPTPTTPSTPPTSTPPAATTGP